MHKLLLIVMLCAASAGAALPTSSARAAEIEWELTDRFRLFDRADAASKEKVNRLLDRLAGNATGKLADNYDDYLYALKGREAAPLRASNWDRTARRYSAGYIYPKTYEIRARLTAPPAGRCSWKVDASPAASEPCSGEVKLAIPARALGGRWGAKSSITVMADAGRSYEADVEITDRLIVAVGDSFISGEGNPDVPADLSKLQPSERFWRVQWPAYLDRRGDPVSIAQWWDEPCHRTLLSWPVLAALRIAAVNKRQAVTIVHLGCSGAVEPEGLTGPQKGLPGCPKNMDELRTCPPSRNEKLSQLDQLRELLEAQTYRRPVDRLFLSIGGNDVGFAGVIAYAALPANGWVIPFLPNFAPLGFEIVCPYRAEVGALRRFCWRYPTAEERFRKLPERYRSVDKALSGLGIDERVVVHTTYPDVLSAPEGGICHHALTERDIGWLSGELRRREQLYWTTNRLRERPAGFEALQSVVPRLLRGVWKWNFQFAHRPGQVCDPWKPDRRDSEVCKSNWVRVSLNRHVQRAAAEHGWTSVNGHEEEIQGHGWCAADKAHPLALPVSVSSGRGWSWSNAALSQFDAYDRTRNRWFRTANDSFITQYGGRDRLIQGSIHPTYRSHIAYADAVTKAIGLSFP